MLVCVCAKSHRTQKKNKRNNFGPAMKDDERSLGPENWCVNGVPRAKVTQIKQNKKKMDEQIDETKLHRSHATGH